LAAVWFARVSLLLQALSALVDFGQERVSLVEELFEQV
jgi:hypothetical protein